MIYTCDITGESKEVQPNKRGSTPIPRGWKRLDGRTYSANAWQDRFVMRAVTIPVASVLDCDWNDFAKALHDSWSQVTRLSNWMMTTLYASDCLASPIGSDGKLPPMVKQYLYPMTGRIAPDVAPVNRSGIEQSIQSLYRKDRFAVRARSNQSLRSYRYPQPLPIVSAVWSYADGTNAKISVPMMGSRFTICLRVNGGSSRAFALLAKGIPAELSLFAKSTGEPMGPAVNIRDNHGQNVRHTVMCKIALWVPKEIQARSGVLRVRTDSDSLLIAINAKDEKLWMYHADHVRRLVGERIRRSLRLNDDRKFEQRRPDASFQTRSTTEVDKYTRKLDTICHEIAAQLVGYADRRKFAEIQYDDSDKRFVERFPYHQLKTNIEQKCERLGIAFIAATAREIE